MTDADIAALKAVLGSGYGSDRGRHENFAGVWPDNRAAVDAFLAASSQWRTAVAMEDGRLRTLWIGLDYAGAAVAWSACGIAPAAAFGGLRIMEATARDALNGRPPS